MKTKWFLFFDINLFYPLKLILKCFGGHFEFFGGHFEFFFADSWSTHKAVETKWFSFFDINFFYPLKLILKFFGGHFEFFGGHFEFFFCGFLVYSQSCGNKVVFVFS